MHPSRVIAGHLDLCTDDRPYLEEVAGYDTFLELDDWGHPCPTDGVLYIG